MLIAHLMIEQLSSIRAHALHQVERGKARRAMNFAPCYIISCLNLKLKKITLYQVQNCVLQNCIVSPRLARTPLHLLQRARHMNFI